MTALRRSVRAATRSRAAWLVAGLWVAAAGVLLARGQGQWLALVMANQVFQLLLVLVTVAVTEPPPRPVRGRESQGKLRLQVIVLLVIILITGLGRLLPAGVPGWSAMVAWFSALGERTLPVQLVGGPGNAVANPVQYFVIPLIALLLLGARLSELGFGRGRRAWRVALLWAAIPVVTFAILLITGMLLPPVLLRRLVGNALQNGFFEEFLFRGALQTRLNGLLPPTWALILQALGFGLWHLEANTAMPGGDWIAGLAACIVSQAVTGLWFGIVFMRTGNLLAPSIQHVLMNVFGQTFG